MKRALTVMLSLWMVLGGAYVPDAGASVELDARVREAKLVLDEVMASPDQSIPEDLLRRCKAIAIYPSVLKGGFIIGARVGKGVIVRRDEKTGQWGQAAFSKIGGGSWGLQIGAEATDLVLVIMNERGLEGLLDNNFTLGADASIAAGPVGRSAEAGTDLSLKAAIYSYSRSRGLFGGVALQGAVVSPDRESNAEYYGRPASSYDILYAEGAQLKPSNKTLSDALAQYAG
ncbi:MAG: hypothetical protein MOGMAGMI_01670 [Candidatus Omnitrophica bacterium]|nr:hypothetical protein [Candidatus Omnitrophota bacterium]